MPSMVMDLLSRTDGSGHQRDAFRQRARRVHELVVRDDLVHHADAQRLLRIEMIAGAAPSGSRLPAAERAQQKCRVRDMANLGLREHRLVRCNGDVGRELVPEAAPMAQPLTAAMIGLPQPPHMGPLRDPAGSLRCQNSMNSACDLPFGSECRVPLFPVWPWS
jgi:hypothetical protein